ncbi:MAG: hypothetical protein O9293_08980 [Porphyrobacter sp.]|nr:hypothetical protein [Porphyrobacter sp.]
MTSHNKDMRRDREPGTLDRSDDTRKRANQEAASRPGVDANNALDHRGHMTSTPHEGSAFQPLREGSDEQRQRDEDSAYVLDQGAQVDDGAGVSRRGAGTQHGDAMRETDPAPGGGSVYQPLAGDPRYLEDVHEKQRGNPAGQSQQGLNKDAHHESGPGEQIRERRDDEPREDEPRGIAGQDRRQP